MSNTFIRRAGIAAALALLLATGASAETRRITLLGSSDIHGYFVPWDYATDTEYKAGALSKIATAVKRIRAEGAPVIVPTAPLYFAPLSLAVIPVDPVAAVPVSTSVMLVSVV